MRKIEPVKNYKRPKYALEIGAMMALAASTMSGCQVVEYAIDKMKPVETEVEIVGEMVEYTEEVIELDGDVVVEVDPDDGSVSVESGEGDEVGCTTGDCDADDGDCPVSSDHEGDSEVCDCPPETDEEGETIPRMIEIDDVEYEGGIVVEAE